jgi:hypothetical protein
MAEEAEEAAQDETGKKHRPITAAAALSMESGAWGRNGSKGGDQKGLKSSHNISR